MKGGVILLRVELYFEDHPRRPSLSQPLDRAEAEDDMRIKRKGRGDDLYK
jgi:hypothetical protein